ncbi:MAG: TlpA disulfide reductase family protein [Sedimentisphaerales bacterium]|nr:TlpA disulfide reductase family protein [Sedimentisphaerales bacterium]HNY79777.1 TlpA disulfide reductase family protein [Sedimentisphaerales bacterium]HOC62245.1 TlpA disulfide reductase family protein [Sedimentisphaerales bacterium]HOH63114.1 TlpA disulfide reductase family protein [Sedimentisphaerales bacterium]HPY51615.1 TlpA disulfide reductase family protein [Sedimentisphaerales bacterium]
MAQKMLMLIPWFVMAAIVGLPLFCVVLYRRRRLGACLLCSHLWCMIAFCLVGMFLLHTARRQQHRADNADKASKLLQTCQTLRAGKVEESQMLLDDHLARALYRTAYDVPDAKMGELDTDVLWVWQQAKEYYDTYDVNEPYVGSMIPRVCAKLSHVPWSETQLAIKKFERTYRNGEPTPAPPIHMKSWIGQPLPNEALAGKVVLLDFWNTRCGPCVKAHPDLQKTHEAYKDRGLVVIACAGGDEKETRQYMEKHAYTFAAGMVARQMYLDYAIRSNPTYFLIDRQGCLAWGPEHRLPTENELVGLLETGSQSVP